MPYPLGGFSPRRTLPLPRRRDLPFDPTSIDYLEERGYEPIDRNVFAGNYDIICDGLEALEDDQRRLIEMYFWERMTLRAIGKELGCDKHSVSRRLSKALKALQEKLA
jgi:RNA polymerase sigma factor (sigma-70 family)